MDNDILQELITEDSNSDNVSTSSEENNNLDVVNESEENNIIPPKETEEDQQPVRRRRRRSKYTEPEVIEPSKDNHSQDNNVKNNVECVTKEEHVKPDLGRVLLKNKVSYYLDNTPIGNDRGLAYKVVEVKDKSVVISTIKGNKEVNKDSVIFI